MKKMYVYFLLILCSLILTAFFFRPALERYALSTLEHRWSGGPLTNELQHLVHDIAQEMAIKTPFYLCKMNHQALVTFGYPNAVCCFPLLFNLIPLGSPFLLVSESFFNGLSQAEQRFLIGHELIHVKEAHTRYQNLCILTLFVIIGMILGVIKKTRLFAYKYPLVRNGVFAIIIFAGGVGMLLGLLVYRRHIEWEADQQSLYLLHSHEGGIVLLERWMKDYSLPREYPYQGWFATHPSCEERLRFFQQYKGLRERNA